LALNEEKIKNIKHGLVVVCVGDSGKFTYKKSRQDDAEIDQTVEYFLNISGKQHAIIDFFPYGYDERQYCSPGFNLPVGCLMRTPHGKYAEYHTSADNLHFVTSENLADSLEVYLNVIGIIEDNTKYLNLKPKCEPQLGKRGLYEAVDGSEHHMQLQTAMLWNLNLADSKNDLLEVARKSKLPFDVVREAAVILEEHNLLKEIE
jgi:aminopeptidase-like protein